MGNSPRKTEAIRKLLAEADCPAASCSASLEPPESLMPERDALWAKHDGLTPALAAELLVLAGKLECERGEARKETIAALMDGSDACLRNRELHAELTGASRLIRRLLNHADKLASTRPCDRAGIIARSDAGLWLAHFDSLNMLLNRA